MAGRPRRRMRRNGLGPEPPAETPEGWLLVLVEARKASRYGTKYIQEATACYIPANEQLEAVKVRMMCGTVLVAWARPVTLQHKHAIDSADIRGYVHPSIIEQLNAKERVQSMLSDREFSSIEEARAGMDANHFAFDPELSGLVFHEWVQQGLLNTW